MPRFSPVATEDYVSRLFRLNETGGSVTTQQMAVALQITSPSVTSMTKRLHERGLVCHHKYHGVNLTEQGRLLAIDVIRRHRLLELLLVTQLDYPWDKVHDEADRLEHSISHRLMRQIDERLQHPRFDPHGAPIPDEAGIFPVAANLPLPVVAAVVENSWLASFSKTQNSPTVLANTECGQARRS